MLRRRADRAPQRRQDRKDPTGAERRRDRAPGGREGTGRTRAAEEDQGGPGGPLARLALPHEAAHAASRKDALAGADSAIRVAKARIVALEGERKKLGDEAEFYPGGRPLPTKLKSDIDRNDAALKAQRAFLQNQQGEQARVNELYDEQLTKLKKLWKR